MQENPDAQIISLGIGDVTRRFRMQLFKRCMQQLMSMQAPGRFRGYGPEQGYDFLIQAIVENDYKARGIDIATNEVFVSDGSKCDVGNIQEIFSHDSYCRSYRILFIRFMSIRMLWQDVPENSIKKRIVMRISFTCLLTAENKFIPSLPDRKVDLIYFAIRTIRQG